MIRLTLDKALAERGMTRYKLAKQTGMQYPVVDNYYKNKVSRYDGDVLDRICKELKCEMSDIIEYVKE